MTGRPDAPPSGDRTDPLRSHFDPATGILQVHGAVKGQRVVVLRRTIDAAQRGSRQPLVIDVSRARELDGHAVRLLRAVERRSPGQRVVTSLLTGSGTPAELAMTSADAAGEPRGSWACARNERAYVSVSSVLDGSSSWSARSPRPR